MDKIDQQCQQPKGSTPFGHSFGVVIEDFDFGENVEVVKEPVYSEEGADCNIEHGIHSDILGK